MHACASLGLHGQLLDANSSPEPLCGLRYELGLFSDFQGLLQGQSSMCMMCLTIARVYLDQISGVGLAMAELLNLQTLAILRKAINMLPQILQQLVLQAEG